MENLKSIIQLNIKDQEYIKSTLLEKTGMHYEDLTDDSKQVILDGFRDAVNKYVQRKKDKQKVYFKKYYDKNRDKHQEYIQTPIQCEYCKCEYKRGKKSVHFASKKHIKNSQQIL